MRELDDAIANEEASRRRLGEQDFDVLVKPGRRVIGRVASAEAVLVRYCARKRIRQEEVEGVLDVLADLGPGSLAGIVRARRLASEIPGPLKGEKARKVARCVVAPAKTGRRPTDAIKDARLYLAKRIDGLTTSEAVSQFARSEGIDNRSALLRLRKARTALRRALDTGVLMYDVGDGELIPSLEHLRAHALAEALADV